MPTGIINGTSHQTFDRQVFRHRAGVIFEPQFDSTSTLKVTFNGTVRNGHIIENDFSNGTDEAGNLLNQSVRRRLNDTEGEVASLNSIWKKKLRKAGRTISWDVSGSFDQRRHNGFLYSENVFYAAPTADSTVIVDQRKVSNASSSAFSSNIAYTEPIADALKLVVNYRLVVINGSSLRQSFNPGALPGDYTVLDSLCSSDFKLNQLANELGASLNFIKRKTNMNFGTKVSCVDFDQTDRDAGTRFERNFVNHNLQVSFRYRIAQQKICRYLITDGTHNPPSSKFNRSA